MENEVTATPSKPTRRSFRQLMVRNDNDYTKHVKVHKRKISYMKAFEALRESRNENPAYKDAFDSLIYDLKKKNTKWDRTSVDDQDLTARVLSTEETTDEEL